jgi:hypothetical protein
MSKITKQAYERMSTSVDELKAIYNDEVDLAKREKLLRILLEFAWVKGVLGAFDEADK